MYAIIETEKLIKMEGQSQKRLQNILNMSLKLTDAEQKTYEATEIDSERKEFLQGAIQNALEDDDSKRLVMYTRCFQTYDPAQNFSEEQTEDLKVLFEALNLLNEGFDISKDFDKLGGLIHCLNILKSNKDVSMLWRAADLIANSIHNNPQCQQTVLDNEGMETFLGYLHNSTEEILQIKCLYALSTLLGGFPVAEKKFCEIENADFFVKMLSIKNQKVRMKTAFMLRKLVYSDDSSVDVFITNNLFEKLLGMTNEDIGQALVHVLHTLLRFLSQKKSSLISKPESASVMMKNFTEKKKELEKIDKDQYDEEIQVYNDLIKLLK